MSRRTASLAARALLAVMLMIGFYALALAVCVALGYLMWVDVEQGAPNPQLWMFGIVVIGVLAWSVFPRRIPFHAPGVEVFEDEQPDLFDHIRDLAEGAGQRMPDHVYLVPEVNAFVTQMGGWLGIGGRRVLGIGLPLMQVLTIPELRSVIAHEFGHFHGGDTRLGPIVYRTRATIARTIVNLKKAETIARKPFEWYGRLFMRVSLAVSRAQEYAADALAVRLVGLTPTQSALVAINRTAPLFDGYVRNEFAPMVQRGVRVPFADGFGRYVNGSAHRALLDDLETHAREQATSVHDTHPALSDRIEAAERVSDAGSEDSEGPLAIELLEGVDELEAELVAFAFGNPEVAELPLVEWEEMRGDVLALQFAESAAQVRERLPRLLVGDLADVGARGEEFVRRLAPGMPPKRRHGAAISLLGTLLANALAQAGFKCETAPGEPVVLRRDTTELEPFALVRDALEGRLESKAWRERARELGIVALAVCGPRPDHTKN